MPRLTLTIFAAVAFLFLTVGALGASAAVAPPKAFSGDYFVTYRLHAGRLPRGQPTVTHWIYRTITPPPAWGIQFPAGTRAA